MVCDNKARPVVFDVNVAFLSLPGEGSIGVMVGGDGQIHGHRLGSWAGARPEDLSVNKTFVIGRRSGLREALRNKQPSGK